MRLSGAGWPGEHDVLSRKRGFPRENRGPQGVEVREEGRGEHLRRNFLADEGRSGEVRVKCLGREEGRRREH